ncbi:M13 family metallopeptidase, partial [Sphingomonas sp.]|uniref:M13 family metallopeptidase n=1 Tax=Sphingomonas sp. TaxID=28214 RepID=UPI002BC87C15
LYASFMDEAAIERAGTTPLKPYLARISALKTRAQLVSLFQTPGYAGPVSVGVTPNFADPTHYAAFATQDGLGLPNRDYYLLPDDKYVAFRTAYRAYVARMLALAGFSDTDARADRIIALETAMAKSQWTPERDRDIKQINNPMDRAQLTKLAPQFDWTRVLGEAGLGKIDTILAIEPSAIADAGKLVETTPLSTWQDYLAFHFISDNAQYLPKAFDQANFEFFSKTLRDVPEQRARWKRGVRLINNMLGEAVGQIYVARHYPPESDRQMGELIGNLRAAYADELKQLKWMDDATRTEALAKLDAFDPRIGHPAKYIDYSSYRVDRADPLGNAMRGREFDWRLELSRLPYPVDRGLWNMTPQEVNAYYSPSQNQITFPAAILQPPYFDPAADPAVNYGGIGAVIGHEMGHGFDDQGRQFDATGKVRDWWTQASADAYVARTKLLGTQFDGYEPVPGTHIKGELTMGENVGDLGGLEMAWGAWQRYKAEHGDPGPIGGVTSDQRFLIAYAYSWQGKTREGALREQILSDPHSPNLFRVNGIVRNFDPWYAAFNVQPGDKLYLPPEQRVHIWVD